jgi:hypothetical protein
VGNISLDDVSYISIHADTWAYGFTFWLDGVHFSSFPTALEELSEQHAGIVISPNPASDFIRIDWSDQFGCPTEIKLYDLTGRIVCATELDGSVCASGHYLMGLPDLRAGIYVLVVSSDNVLNKSKLIIR